MRALATVVQHDIVSICPNGVMLFLKGVNDKHNSYEGIASRTYRAKYAKLDRDLPSEVLTWFDNSVRHVIFSAQPVLISHGVRAHALLCCLW